MELPDRKDLPDYYKVITNPISLQEIEVSLHSRLAEYEMETDADGQDRMIGRKYETVDEFFAELETMCNNAFTYNEDDSDVFKDAKQIMVRSFVEHMSDMKLTSIEHPRISSQRDSRPFSATPDHQVQSHKERQCEPSPRSSVKQRRTTCQHISAFSSTIAYAEPTKLSNATTTAAGPSVTTATHTAGSVPAGSAQGCGHRGSRCFARTLSAVRTTGVGADITASIDAGVPTDPSWKRSSKAYSGRSRCRWRWRCVSTPKSAPTTLTSIGRITIIRSTGW